MQKESAQKVPPVEPWASVEEEATQLGVAPRHDLPPNRDQADAGTPNWSASEIQVVRSV